MTSTRFIAITGGPGSGKSTLIEALAARGHAVSPETGRAVIRDQMAIDGPALPWADRARFADLMLDREIVAWRAAAAVDGPVFFDRGVPDTIGYLTLEELEVPAHMLRAAEEYRYAPVVFVAPHWPAIYARDGERKQSEELARRTCDAVSAAWRRSGYRLVPLPLATVADRVRFVLDQAKGIVAACR